MSGDNGTSCYIFPDIDTADDVLDRMGYVARWDERKTYAHVKPTRREYRGKIGVLQPARLLGLPIIDPDADDNTPIYNNDNTVPVYHMRFTVDGDEKVDTQRQRFIETASEMTNWEVFSLSNTNCLELPD